MDLVSREGSIFNPPEEHKQADPCQQSPPKPPNPQTPALNSASKSTLPALEAASPLHCGLGEERHSLQPADRICQSFTESEKDWSVTQRNDRIKPKLRFALTSLQL